MRERHDEFVEREGTFDKAVEAIREAQRRGFRVNTNTTFLTTDTPKTVRDVLDFLNDELKVDQMMLSPAYAYEKAPDQEHFPGVAQARKLFSESFADGKRKRWRLNHTPLFLDFLEGKVDFQCTPWGIPSYSLFGWQRPCYLMADGYTATYKELIETTDWSKYGRGNDPRCDNCMAHCGYEPTAVARGDALAQAVAARARLRLTRREANDTAAASANAVAKPGSDAPMPRLRRVEPREEVRPEAEILRLREPLVDGEAGEPGDDHPRPERGRAEDVVGLVVRAVQQPVGEQHAEQRHEEGAQEQEELLVVGEVEHERGDGRDRCGADDEPRAAARSSARSATRPRPSRRSRTPRRSRPRSARAARGSWPMPPAATVISTAVGPSIVGCESTRIEPNPNWNSVGSR